MARIGRKGGGSQVGGGGGGESEPKGPNVTAVSSDITFLCYKLCFQGGGFRIIPQQNRDTPIDQGTSF